MKLDCMNNKQYDLHNNFTSNINKNKILDFT